MAEITEETIAELEALEKAATAGPWSWEQTGDKDNSWCAGVSCDQEGNAVAGLIEEEFDDDAHEFLPKPDVVEFICESGNDGTFADAALLVALRNAAPQLIAAARRSLAYEAFLREHNTVLVAALGNAVGRNTLPKHIAMYEGASKSLKALLERLK